jgi:predicted phage terminase large subunit-like protein
MAGNLFDLDEIFPAAAPTAAAKPSTNDPAAAPPSAPTLPDTYSVTDEIAELIAEAQAIAAHLEKEVLLNDFLAFVRAAWHLVEPKIKFRSNWHIERIAEELMRVADGEVKRLIINVPPGTMKSLLVSVFFPVWLWARDGSKRFLTASYGATLATRDNVRVRTIIESEWFQSRFELRLSEDQNAKTKYLTSEGGWRFATSVGGAGTGEHPDIVIIDDPTTAQQAKSDAMRTEANDWFDRTVSSRGVSRDVAIIIIMQRLHMNDLTGHVLEKDKGQWETVCFPMRYEIERESDPEYAPDPRDPRTTPGELLWPELFTEKKVRQLEIDLGPFSAAGQLQQNPVPEGGGLFKRGWFKILDAMPVSSRLRMIRGWDTAGTEDDGDYTVGVKMAELDGIYIVVDVVRGQLGPAGVDELIKNTANADGRNKVGQREEKEGGSAGLAVINARAKTLKGHDYSGVSVSGDKVTRAKPFRAQCEAGNVFLLRGEWNESYLNELSFFPVGNHDDQVDASSCAFNAIVGEPVTGGVLKGKATWG